MRSFVSLVSEILLVRRVEPVIGYSDMETTSLVCQGKIKLLGIFRLRKTYTSPSSKRQTFISDTQGRLQGNGSQILTTPVVLANDISTDRSFYLVLRHGSRSKSHQTECQGTHLLHI